MPKNPYLKWGLLALAVGGVSFYISLLNLDDRGSGEVGLEVSRSPVIAGKQMQYPGGQQNSFPGESGVLEAADVHLGESGAHLKQHTALPGQLALQSKPSEDKPPLNESGFLPGVFSEDIFIGADELDGLTKNIDDEQINLGDPLDPDAEVISQLPAADGMPAREIGRSLDPEGDVWMFEMPAVDVEGGHIDSLLDPDSKEAVTYAHAPVEEVVNIGEHIDLDLSH